MRRSLRRFYEWLLPDFAFRWLVPDRALHQCAWGWWCRGYCKWPS